MVHFSADLHEGEGEVQGVRERHRLEDQEDGWHEGVSNFCRDRAASGESCPPSGSLIADKASSAEALL